MPINFLSKIKSQTETLYFAAMQSIGNLFIKLSNKKLSEKYSKFIKNPNFEYYVERKTLNQLMKSPNYKGIIYRATSLSPKEGLLLKIDKKHINLNNVRYSNIFDSKLKEISNTIFQDLSLAQSRYELDKTYLKFKNNKNIKLNLEKFLKKVDEAERKKLEEKFDLMQKSAEDYYKIRIGLIGEDPVKEEFVKINFGEQIISDLENLKEKYISAFSNLKTESQMKEVYSNLFGKNGDLTYVLSKMKFIDFNDRTKIGSIVNNFKSEMDKIYDNRVEFINKNTRKDLIKICNCAENCYCEYKERIIFTENNIDYILN